MNYIDDMILKLDSLYNMYEMYMWKHEDSKLEVLIQDGSMCFFLYNNNDVIDNLVLQFDEGDRGTYAYLCIRLVIIMLGNVIIHVDDNILYNDVHKPYLKVFVNDDGILSAINKIIKYQDKIVIHGEMDILKQVRMMLPKIRYPRKFMKNFDERISLSRKLLRGGGN